MIGILLIDSCEGKRIRPEKSVIKGGIFPANYSYAGGYSIQTIIMFWEE